MKLPVKKLHRLATIPTYGSADAAGADLYACIIEEMDVYPDNALAPTQIEVSTYMVLQPGERKLIPTKIAAAVPAGYYGRVAPRSGLAYKTGIDVMAGVVDADYRGELYVLLINLSDKPFTVAHGDRIAQFIFERCDQGEFEEVDVLPETVRGAGGFGSTGIGAMTK